MKNYKNHLTLFLFLTTFTFALIITLSCDDSPNGPDEPPPGRRDYRWKVDTVNVPFNYLTRMWGSSPTDIWAVGSGGSSDQRIWHYDGDDWKTDGISKLIGPASVYGFSSDNVWFAGREGKIFHYDGKSFVEKFYFENPGSFGLYVFMDIWGPSTDEIYAVGFIDSLEQRKAMMFKYNGNEWARVSLPKNNFTIHRIRKYTEENNFYFNCRAEHSQYPDSNALVSFNGREFEYLFFDIADKDGKLTISDIGDNYYATIGDTVFIIQNNKKIMVDIFDNNQFGNTVFGRNENDLFLRMEDGIAHYNGTDVEYLQRFDTRQSVMDEAIFEKEVFLLVIDFERDYNLIYHGTLNN
jgi:hypothetical protein